MKVTTCKTTGLPMIDFDGPRRLGTIPRTGPQLMRSAAGVIPDIPKSEWREINRRKQMPWILDQKSHGSCTGHGSAGAQMRARKLRGLTHVMLSGAYPYSFVNGGRDNGAVIHDLLPVLRDRGTCKLSQCDWNQIYRSQYNAAECDATAKRFRLADAVYAENFNQIICALLSDWVPVYAVQVGSRFSTLDSKGRCGYDSGPGNHCCLPTTVVASKEMKRIDQVVVGDMVYDHEGQSREVTEVLTRQFTGNLAIIKAAGCPRLTVTEDHPILVYRTTTAKVLAGMAGGVTECHDAPVTTNGGRKLTPAWVKAKDVRPGDKVITPRIPLEKSQDPNWDFFVGYFCGNGSFIVDKDRGAKGIHVDLPVAGPVERIISILEKSGNPTVIWRGRNGSLVSCEEATSVRIRMSGKEFADSLMAEVGRYSGDRRLPRLSEAAVDGLLAADSCLYKGRRIYATTSFVMAQQVRLAAISMGYKAAMSEVASSRGQFANAKPQWRVSWNEQPGKQPSRTRTGAIFSEVRTVLLAPYNGPVYNLEVEESHSFLADTTATHNCVMADGIKLEGGDYLLDMVNSWGTSFGQSGRGYITEKHIDGIGYQDIYLIQAAVEDPEEPDPLPPAKE